MPPTTVASAMQRRRIVRRVAQTAGRLAAWTGEQGAAIDGPARLAPAIQEAVARIASVLQPTIRQAGERIYRRPEKVKARRKGAKIAAARDELLGLRMTAFRRG